MKKFLLMIMLMMSICFSSFAQVQYYRTTAFASATINQYTGKYVWSNWQSSDMLIVIDIGNDVITIYSPVTQKFAIYGTYNNGNSYIDNTGGQNVKFYAVDNDYDKCEIRLRIERNGNSQIYIDYSNIALVYNVRRTS